MAKYDIREAELACTERIASLKSAQDVLDRGIDITLVDMLGFFLWTRLNEKQRTEEGKKVVIYASLLAAFMAGKEGAGTPKEMASAFFDFVEKELEIPPVINEFDDLLDW